MEVVRPAAFGEAPTPRFTGGLSEAARSRLGSRIRNLAATRGVSQTALVKRTGLGRSTIEDLWWGRSNPTLNTVLAVVYVLRLGSIEELLGPLGTQLILGDMVDAEGEATAS